MFYALLQLAQFESSDRGAALVVSDRTVLNTQWLETSYGSDATLV